jgi:hypothetical protein
MLLNSHRIDVDDKTLDATSPGLEEDLLTSPTSAIAQTRAKMKKYHIRKEDLNDENREYEDKQSYSKQMMNSEDEDSK